jgi:nicotinamidase-related amidase
VTFAQGTTLLCIDMQQAVLFGPNGPDEAAEQAYGAMLARVARVQAAAREAKIPLVHVQHEEGPDWPLARGTPGWQFRAEVAPIGGEPVVAKQSCDSFHETDLEKILTGSRRLVVVGCMTQFCIDTTCRRAVSLGYDVTLVGDAHMNAGSAGLTFAQVIAHHNACLDGFNAGKHAIRVVSSSAL